MISEKPFSLSNTAKLLRQKPREAVFENGCFFFMGRDALACLLDAINVGSETTAMIPAYTCLENVHPFTGRGVKTVFYDIGADLEIEVEKLARLIEENNAKIVLWINYFGVIQKKIAKLMERYQRRVVFIEDCSHSLLSEGSGHTGDFVFASLRKILPVPDGGILWANPGSACKPNYKPRIWSDLGAFLLLLKETYLAKSLKISRRKLSRVSQGNLPRSKAHPRLSGLSNTLLSRLDTAGIHNCRRTNYQIWQRRLEPFKATRVISDLGEGACPFGFPLLIPGRDHLVSSLRKKRIFLKVDWPWTGGVPESCKVAYKLSANSVTLPVHQDIDEKSVDLIIREMRAILGDNWSWNESLCD